MQPTYKPAHVVTALDLSTAHVPLTEASGAEEATARLILFAGQRAVSHEHGWIWFVPDTLPPLEPGWLGPIFEEAQRHGALFVNFDQDAPIVANLPNFTE